MVKRFITVLFIALLSSVTVLAVDDQGNPNDPTVNPRANACYEGGTMADRCTTDLDWQAGWYLIRFEAGLITRDAFPAWLAWVLPPLPQPVTSGITNCFDTNFQDFVQTGNVDQSPSGYFVGTFDGTCSSIPGAEGTLVQAADLAEATTKCNTLITNRSLTITAPPELAGGDYPANYYFCSYVANP